MIIERFKKLREEKRIKEAEKLKYFLHYVILSEISKYFTDHPTENKVFLNVGSAARSNFDEDYAMSLDSGRPYIIKKMMDKYGEYIEVTHREEYRPELYYYL